MSTIWTGRFWQATAERAVKTFGQAAAATFTIDKFVNITELDWQLTFGSAATAALFSVLTSLASSRAGEDGPSLAWETIAAPAVPGEIVAALEQGNLRSGKYPPELVAAIVKAIRGYWGGNAPAAHDDTAGGI